MRAKPKRSDNVLLRRRLLRHNKVLMAHQANTPARVRLINRTAAGHHYHRLDTVAPMASHRASMANPTTWCILLRPTVRCTIRRRATLIHHTATRAKFISNVSLSLSLHTCSR